MITDWKDIATDALTAAQAIGEGLAPSFVAFTVAPSPATLSYLAIKRRQAERAGIVMQVREFPDTVTTEELIEAVGAVEEDAVIVQLPLPAHIDMMRVLEAIPIEKDADVLSPRARAEGPVTHPIAASVADILSRAGVHPEGKRAAVVGQGWLVGKPVAEWLTRHGAEVTTVTKEEGNLTEALATAEIIVSGAGSPGIITAECVPPGAIVIDVGTSELGGSLRGDVADDVAAVAGLVTPVPGGVGPIAVAYLMKNVAELARLRRG